MRYLAHDLGDHDSAEIYPLFDIHIPNFDEALFTAHRDHILAAPNRFAIIGGDIGNYATPGSVSDSWEDDLTPQQQFEKACALLGPLFAAKRILMLIRGNHDFRINRATGGIDLCWMLCDKFGQGEVYLKDGGTLKLSLGKGDNGKRVTYLAYGCHGHGGGRRVGSKANAAEDLQRLTVADIYIVGHTHQSAAFPRALFLPDPQNGKVRLIKQLFVMAGAYQEWGGYTERKNYPPMWLGCPTIALDGRKKDAKAVIG